MRMPANRITALLILLLVFGTLSLNAQSGTRKISRTQLYNKIYASWLGQLVGNIYGLPHENAYIEKAGPSDFPYGYGPNIKALKENDGAFSDDDTDIEYMYLIQMQENGIEPTYGQLAEAWKYHIRDRVWLANRAALGAMHFGFKPPITGDKEYNPHWFQIDPQLVNEIWGVTSPGMIQYASDKSAWAAKITNDGWGLEPTIHYGAMYAAAFFESDVVNIIDAGTKALPEDSRFAGTVDQMKVLHQKYPDDWRKARQEMANKYYYNEPIETRTIWNANLNGAAGILALLYGDGDFQKTLDLACAMGFDADNQAATMSGLLALMKGKKIIPNELLFPLEDAEWEKPFNDKYVNITRHDLPDSQITDMAKATTEQAIKAILQNGGKKIEDNGEVYFLINTQASFSTPLEFYKAPKPEISINEKVSYTFNTSIPSSELNWSIEYGGLPSGLELQDGQLTGVANEKGLFPVTLKASDGSNSVTRTLQLVVNGNNIAPSATEVLSNVARTDTAARNNMWLTVSQGLYADQPTVINDGKTRGQRSVFYSINGQTGPKYDYYGYKWSSEQDISSLVFYTGSMEESGGWFESLYVEYLDSQCNWQQVKNLRISPNLMPGDEQFNKPHFVNYNLSFEPVKSHGIRILGQAGNTDHWQNEPFHFTSITELEVYSSTSK